MRLTTVILIASLMQVSASGLAQRITLNQRNASLETILKEIRKQTSYDFFYDRDKIQESRQVDINVKNATVNETLDKIFADLPFTYTINGNLVSIKPKEPSFLDRLAERWAAIDVRGSVVDEMGKPLIGANIKVKGSGKARTTGSDGAFYLPGVDEKDVIVVSFIGYVTQELKAKKDLGEIRLAMASSDLQEVTINKGYYTTTRALNTGNVSSVTAKDIDRQPVSDPMLTLQGRVPGLYIQQTSGMSGRALTIRLRGQNSLDNGLDPLFIVDGIQFSSKTLSTGISNPAGGAASPFNYLNPADIESIDVLKDADATAIYGSRGANGVILITTKKGKEGKTQVDVNLSSGLGKVVQRLKYMNTQEYLAMRKQAFANDGVTPNINNAPDLVLWDQNRYTNWQDELIGGSAQTTEASVGVSGGNRLTSFRISGTYRKEGTVYPGDFTQKRMAAHFNINHQSADERFNVSLSGSFSNSTNDLPDFGGSTAVGTNMDKLILLAPNSPEPYNADGTLNWANNTWINPYAVFEASVEEATKNLTSGLTLRYKILAGLELKGDFAYNYSVMEQTNLSPLTAFNPSNYPYNIHRYLNNKRQGWSAEPQLSYSSRILGGKVDALIGTTFQSSGNDYFAMEGLGFANDALINNLMAAGVKNLLARSGTEYRYTALYSRLGYSYQDKYLLNVTARRDGSSRFGPGKRFGNFGAVGAAWILSEENFMKNLTWLSFAKLRASYGITGNDQLRDYEYLDTYSVVAGNYQNVISLNPKQLTNPFYGWEQVNKLELAIEIGVLDNRLNASASVYQNRTTNQLVQYPLSSITGFPSVRANLPAVLENKGLEIELNSINVNSGNFSWTSSANITFPTNKLISFANLASSGYANRYAIGEPLTLWSFYHYTGQDPNTRLYTFEDYNGDGRLTSAFDRKLRFIGQKFYGGLQNNFKLKGFELDFLIQFVKQNGYGVYNSNTKGFFAEGFGNQYAAPSRYIPELQITQSNSQIYSNYASNFLASDGPLQDASFIRLKNVSVSWKIPFGNKVTRVMKNTTVYIQGQNLLTITKYQGADPEINGTANSALAPLRMIVAGLKSSF